MSISQRLQAALSPAEHARLTAKRAKIVLAHCSPAQMDSGRRLPPSLVFMVPGLRPSVPPAPTLYIFRKNARRLLLMAAVVAAQAECLGSHHLDMEAAVAVPRQSITTSPTHCPRGLPELTRSLSEMVVLQRQYGIADIGRCAITEHMLATRLNWSLWKVRLSSRGQAALQERIQAEVLVEPLVLVRIQALEVPVRTVPSVLMAAEPAEPAVQALLANGLGQTGGVLRPVKVVLGVVMAVTVMAPLLAAAAAALRHVGIHHMT